MEIPQKLRDYIDSNRAPLPPIKDLDEPLQIDSLALVRLVAFLESDFEIQIDDEELVAENFATLRKLGELIGSKSKAPPRTVDPSSVRPSATSVRDPGPAKEG